MIALRHLQWPADRDSLLALDTSFTTDLIYRIKQTKRSFALEEIAICPPVKKDYPLAGEFDALLACDWVKVASDTERIIGLAAMSVEQWNRRGVLHHLYVATAARRRGAGRVLVEEALREAGRQGARCLWVETQNTNYRAIQFYERLGFVWCGLDTTLYIPGGAGAEEIGLFFMRPLTP